MMQKYSKFIYGTIAAAFVLFAVFVVLPMLPEVDTDGGVLSTAASLVAAAPGGGGGDGCGGCGDGGGDGGGNDGGGGDGAPVKKPTCRASASPTSLPYGGGNVNLSWSSQNATSATASGYGTVGTSGNKTVFVSQTRTFSVTVTGPGGSATCSGTVTVAPKPQDPAPQKPVCTSSASPRNLPAGGGNVNFSWNTQNATSASVSGIGPVALNGSASRNITQTTTYTLTATGPGGSVQCSETITVAAETPKPTCESSATPNHVPYGGGNVRFTWSTTNATKVTINNGIGEVQKSGNVTRFIDKDVTYTLTATGPGGTVQCQERVGVGEPKPPIDPPGPKRPTCDAFSANPDSFGDGGGTTQLSWATTNATSVSINQGVGSVPVDGSKNVAVNTSKTFVLTATGPGGSVQCSDSVTVDDIPPPNPLTCDSFTASPNNLDEDGGEVTLSWNTTGATSVSINHGVGSVPVDGSEEVDVDDDTTFTLTATRGSDQVTCTTFVNVEEDDDDNDRLRCELDVSDRRVDEGDRVRLTWETDGAEHIEIEDDDGDEIVDTRGMSDSRREDMLSDSEYVRVREDTRFTLTARSEDGDTERCRVTVRVDEDDDVTVITDTDIEPLVESITLDRVPYTGFEAGPMLTTAFYSLLILWSAGVAYMLVIKKTTIMGFGLAGAAAAKAAPAAMAAGAVMAHAPQQAPVAQSVAPVADIPANLPTAPYAPVVAPMAPALEVADDLGDEMAAIENRAHEARVLLSSDALRHIMAQESTMEGRLALLNEVIERTKASYPSEDGWVVLNKERLLATLG